MIGRSRHCDISLRQSSGYLRQPRGERDRNHDFNTVSRRHTILVIEGTHLTIEDLSTNGTFCDEMLLTGIKGFDLTRASPLLRLGTRESFRIKLLPDPEEVAPAAAEAAGSPLHGHFSQSSYDTCEPFDAPAVTEQVDLMHEQDIDCVDDGDGR